MTKRTPERGTQLSSAADKAAKRWLDAFDARPEAALHHNFLAGRIDP